MTPRTIESEFSEELLKQVNDEFPHDLTMDGPIMHKLHPQIIWRKLQFQHGLEIEPPMRELHGWKISYFSNTAEAEKTYPEIQQVFVGRPWSLNQFLQGQFESAIIDFPPLGTVVISHNELPPEKEIGLHHHLLSPWLSYALSPELWGAQGKWTLFHARLHQTLKEHNLLDGADSVGYYPLKEQARALESLGFQGTNLEKSYVLVLPWTFSLTELEKLEAIIRQEF